MKLFLSLSFLFSAAAFCADPVCHQCEIIREYNKEHPGTDGYYEDYLKEHPKAKQEPQTEIKVEKENSDQKKSG